MRTQEEFTLLIVGLLADAGTEYMVSGSFAADYYGEPRSTHETDIVVDSGPVQFQRLADALGTEFYLNRPAMQDAIANRGMFNIIDTHSGWKADLILRKERPFSIEEFARRRAMEFEGDVLWIVSPEDAILSKLEWAKNSDSQRQLQDATSIATVQWDGLDLAYIQRWAAELGVDESLHRVLAHIRGRSNEDA